LGTPPTRAIALLPLLAALACGRPDHIEIEPRAPRLTRTGELVRLRALLVDRGGRVFARERASWSSRDPFIAAVDADGQVAALSSGHTVLTARWNELVAEVPLEVDLVEALHVEPGTLALTAGDQPVQLRVRPLGLDGRPQRDRQVRLVSGAPGVASVDPEGRIWPLCAGEAWVLARVDHQEAAVRVVVRGRRAGPGP
jgi:hypothetical protein